MLWKQAKVECVQDRAHAGDRVIKLEMAIVVEAESGHPIAGLDPQPLQGSGEPVDTGYQVRVGHPVHALVALGDDLAASVEAFHSPHHVLHSQLVVLHQAFHCGHLHQLAVGSTLLTLRSSMVSLPGVACTER